MINNKVVTIKKKTHFDKPWTLFSPIKLPKYLNASCSTILIDEIIPLISKAEDIHLILGREGITNSVLNELKWVNKYIKFKLIAKNEKIVSSFSGLEFSDVKIDPSIDFNYIGIQGKESLFVILDIDNVKVDDSIEKVFFEEKSLVKAFNFNGVEEIYIVDNEENNDYLSVAEEAKKNNISVKYICNKDLFSKKILDNYSKICDKVIVADNYYSAIFCVYENDVTSYIFKHGCFIPVNFPSFNLVVENAYICLNKNLQEITSDNNVFVWSNGEIAKLEIKPNIDINIDVAFENYSDFAEQKFDMSIVDDYNNYSNLTKQVTYNFILIPPVVDNTFIVSQIYQDVSKICDEWKSKKDKNSMDKFKSKLLEIDKSNSFVEFLSLLDSIEKQLTQLSLVKKADYRKSFNLKGYNKNLNTFATKVTQFKDNILLYCRDLYNIVVSQNSYNKFDKFDDEILDYQKIIEDKQKLIQQGKDVLSNQRRIDILNNKIENLKKLKLDFEEKHTLISSKNCESFLGKCGEYLLTKSDYKSSLSLSNVLKINEQEKTLVLERLFALYLNEFYDFVVYTETILKNLISQDYPDDYLILEKDNKSYIIIDSEDEYINTKHIQEKYGLCCVVRR